MIVTEEEKSTATFSTGTPMLHDPAILQIVSGLPPTTYPDVVGRLTALDQVLPPTDGLRWFNRLYAEMTKAVIARAPGGGFSDPVFLEDLDCRFCGLYFSALRSFLAGAPMVAHAWQPLFEGRERTDVAPLQFALVGVNAHINRDLCVALTEAFSDLGGDTSPTGPRHDDFVVIDAVLAEVHERVKEWLITGALLEVDRVFGRHDDLLEIWSLARAREAAWINGQLRWRLRMIPFLADDHLQSLDRITELAGRGLLRPLPL
jgi:uncharacterized protein DUF5995